MRTTQILTITNIAKMLKVSDYYNKNIVAMNILESISLDEVISHLKYIASVRKDIQTNGL